MEIVTRLHPRSVFVAGEVVQCTVQFSLRGRPSQGGGRNASGKAAPPILCVAWASAQLQCECVVASDASTTATGNSLDVHSAGMSRNSSRTSFRGVDWLEGTQIMASSPKLLFCELALREGDVRVFNYTEVLPADIPPSYRGKNIKFQYHLLIGAQLLNSAVEVLKVPFRVLTSPMPSHESHSETKALNQLSISNPFLPDDGEVPGTLSRQDTEILHSSLLSVKQPACYDIAVPSGPIAKLGLPRTSFKMGEEIVACLQFPERSDVRCVQYSANLVSEEEIFSSVGLKDKPSRIISKSKVAKTHDFTLGFQESSLRVEIPLHVVPSFTSSFCSLSWHLQFHFVIIYSSSNKKSKKSPKKQAKEEEEAVSGEWSAPQKMPVQTLEWSLPIHIFAGDPVHVEWMRTSTTRPQSHTFFLAAVDDVVTR